MNKMPFQDIEAEDAQKLIEQGQVVVVDVRMPYEYETGHIETARLVPIQGVYEFATQLQAEAIPTEQPVLFVCEMGGRSVAASQVAAQLGYQTIYNLDGGMNYWRYLGLPYKK